MFPDSLKNSPARWLITGAIAFFILFQIGASWTRLKPFWTVFQSGFSRRVDPQKIQRKTDIVNLNHFRPDVSTLLTEPAVIDRDDLLSAKEYYRRIVQAFPNEADGYGLLAFCEFYLGEKEEAFVNYRKAAALNPNFFWYPYNTALILLEEGRYQDAAALFHQAVSIPPQDTVKSLVSSRVYGELIRSQPLGDDFAASLKTAYSNGFRLRSFCLYKSGHQESDSIGELVSPQEFSPQLF